MIPAMSRYCAATNEGRPRQLGLMHLDRFAGATVWRLMIHSSPPAQRRLAAETLSP